MKKKTTMRKTREVSGMREMNKIIADEVVDAEENDVEGGTD